MVRTLANTKQYNHVDLIVIDVIRILPFTNRFPGFLHTWHIFLDQTSVIHASHFLPAIPILMQRRNVDDALRVVPKDFPGSLAFFS
jgi:hypothetical protein